MNDDFKKTAMQSVIGLAALLNLLEEKGIITEDEYKKYYEEAQKVIFDEAVKLFKAELF